MGGTPSSRAARAATRQDRRLLLEAGADKEAKEYDGKTAPTTHGRTATRRSSLLTDASAVYSVVRPMRRDLGKDLYDAVRNGNGARAAAPRAQKAPLSRKLGRGHATEHYSNPRPAHALSLSLCGKKRRGEGLERRRRTRATPLPLSPLRRLSLARGPSRSLSRRAPLSHKQMLAMRLLRQNLGGTWPREAYTLPHHGEQRPRGDRAAAARGRGGQGGEG